MEKTVTNHVVSPETDPVAFYRVSSERHLRPNELLTNHFTTDQETKQVPTSKFTSSQTLISKATEMLSYFEMLSINHDEAFRIAGPAAAVQQFINEFNLHLSDGQCGEAVTTILCTLRSQYALCLERFNSI